MIVVTVELWSAVTGRKSQLARMHISNDGEATLQNHRVGDYVGETFVGRDAEALAKGRVSKRGNVRAWRRHDFHVWNLVRWMLESMGYDQGAPKTGGARAGKLRADREAMARIIDEDAWRRADACPVGGGEVWTAESLAKADRILGLPAERGR